MTHCKFSKSLNWGAVIDSPFYVIMVGINHIESFDGWFLADWEAKTEAYERNGNKSLPNGSHERVAAPTRDAKILPPIIPLLKRPLFPAEP